MCVLVLITQLSLSNKMKIVRCFSDAAAASILEQRMFCAKFKLRYVYSACEQFKAKEKLLIALHYDVHCWRLCGTDGGVYFICAIRNASQRAPPPHD